MFKSAASVGDGTTDEGMGDDLWFTSLDDFKPLCHMLHRGRYVTSYFACAHKTGQHFLLKKYEKREFLRWHGAGRGYVALLGCNVK